MHAATLPTHTSCHECWNVSPIDVSQALVKKPVLYPPITTYPYYEGGNLDDGENKPHEVDHNMDNHPAAEWSRVVTVELLTATENQ